MEIHVIKTVNDFDFNLLCYHTADKINIMHGSIVLHGVAMS